MMLKEQQELFARLKKLEESKASAENEVINEGTELEDNKAGTDDDNMNSN